MDAEKIKQLMELASNVYGTGFWKDIFDQNTMNPFMGDAQDKMSTLKDMMNGKQTPPVETQGNNISHRPYPNQPAYSNGDPGYPLVDIIKKDGKIIILIDLPGMNKEEVNLMINQNYLIVKGTPKSIIKESEVEVVLYERRHGAFERHIMLPEPTNGSNITAKFYNGVLQVSYPRLEQTGDVIPID
ncbi:Hsp20/alpha crystallin family protein [Bacillus sp. 165]|uniref:Hsp20/alpha crystallin family protein n=1 Tax=Bacillus sp. 165 TaxID=1529117 RepID=UPI001ADCD7E7|nr:Hsp20/alpha crystallin family protein [Bacillus sp. 165]MBO9128387.1 Hsp20/alpha crystallin family protein [Bacillus sp. 165]